MPGAAAIELAREAGARRQRRPRLDRAAARRRPARGAGADRGGRPGPPVRHGQPRPRRSSAAGPVDGLLEFAAAAVVKRGPKGATVLARGRRRRHPLRGRDRARRRGRHDRRRRRLRRRVPRRLVRGAGRRAVAAGVAPARGRGGSSGGGAPAVDAAGGAAARLTGGCRLGRATRPRSIDRLAIDPRGRGRPGRGPAGRRPRIHADQPRPAVSRRTSRSRRRPRRRSGRPARSRRRSRSTTGGCSSASTRRPCSALATAPAGSVRKAARPSLAAALAGGGWAATTVSATMIAAHAAGIAVFATGGIGGVHRGALAGRAPAIRRHGRADRDLRHLVRPRGARPDADGRRLRRPEGDPRRPGHARVPRDARRPGRRRRPGRPARVLRPLGRHRRARLRPGRRRRRGLVADPSRARPRWRRSSCACRCPEADALPGDVARAAVERAIDEATRGRSRGSGPHPVAARPDRRPDRWRLDPRQHRPDRQRRRVRRCAGRAAAASDRAHAAEPRRTVLVLILPPRLGARYTRRVPINGSRAHPEA